MSTDLYDLGCATGGKIGGLEMYSRVLPKRFSRVTLGRYNLFGVYDITLHVRASCLSKVGSGKHIQKAPTCLHRARLKLVNTVYENGEKSNVYVQVSARRL